MNARAGRAARGSRARSGLQVWQLGVLITTVVTVVTNVLANALPIAGRTTAEVSDAYPTLVTPAGYVFSIWGVIYLGLVGYAVWQALPTRAANDRVRAVALPIVVANVANALWIVAWHNLWIGTSLVLMLVLLASLIAVYRGLRDPRGTARSRQPSRGERLWARGTFSVYLGWITVATVANVSAYLVQLGWDGGFVPAEVWGAFVLLVATYLGMRLLHHYRDLAYAAVLVWAFVGITVAQRSVWVVAATAVVGVLALAYRAADLRRHGGYTAHR
jgi:translocator protein